MILIFLLSLKELGSNCVKKALFMKPVEYNIRSYNLDFLIDDIKFGKEIIAKQVVYFFFIYVPDFFFCMCAFVCVCMYMHMHTGLCALE